jgi:hypothetical protein
MVFVPATFEEYWPYYVSQHQDATNRRMHFVGTTLAMGCLALTPWVPMAALAAPVAVYSLAWLGHLAFEKNKPATWMGGKYILWSARGDLRMWMYMLEGTMHAEVERHRDAALAFVRG